MTSGTISVSARRSYNQDGARLFFKPEETETRKGAPYALKKQHFLRGNYPTWNEQKKLYPAHPEYFDRLDKICGDLHADTIHWLNEAYACVLTTMQPLLANKEYLWLWGWNHQKYGSGCGVGS